MLRRPILAAAVLLAASFMQSDRALGDAPDPWKALAFLEGTWGAQTKGGSAAAQSRGTYSFVRELRGHVLARHTASQSACKGPLDYDCEHTDLLFVYEEGLEKTLKAIYFDNEGHVIHYNVSTPGADAVVFLSPVSSADPQFRLTYTLDGAILTGRFEMRMPGAGPWNTYLEWRGPRVHGKN